MNNINNNVSNEVVALGDENLDQVNGGFFTTIMVGAAAASAVATIVKSVRDIIKLRKQQKRE